MNFQTHEEYYIENPKYTKILAQQDPASFKKYTNLVEKYTNRSGRFLDVGCGTGTALAQIPHSIVAKGVDIARTSIEEAKQNGLDCIQYDGARLPFQDKSFNVVGSFDVLEHTDDPVGTLNEQHRVLENHGFLIIVCPNFLSTTNSYHHHTKGLLRKVLNFYETIRRVGASKPRFQKMQTINRVDFHSDDDACNVTNPLDILAWGKQKGLRLESWSGRSVYKEDFSKYLDIPILRVFLGSSCIVFEKLEN